MPFLRTFSLALSIAIVLFMLGSVQRNQVIDRGFGKAISIALVTFTWGSSHPCISIKPC